MTDSLIEARQLCKWYRTKSGSRVNAVNNITLTIPRSTFTVFTGPSGSGKTTLLSLLGCLDRPNSGTLMVDGHDISASSDHQLARLRRRIGFLFQDFALLPKLNLLDNIGYPLIPRGIPRTDRRRIGLQFLERLDLSRQIFQRPEELSTGERQRVAFARALASEPILLLADEPTSHLDEQNSERVMSILKELQAQGTTIIATTHDPKLLSAATEVICLKEGMEAGL